MSPGFSSMQSAPSSEAVLEELRFICESGTFARAAEARRLLRFLVSTERAGNADDLHEVQIGATLYGREPSYDPKLDGIVRVNASRLRARLEEHYASRPSAVRIVLPVGSYVPLYEQGAPVGAERSAYPKGSAVAPAASPNITAPGNAAGARPSGTRVSDPAQPPFGPRLDVALPFTAADAVAASAGAGPRLRSFPLVISAVVLLTLAFGAGMIVRRYHSAARVAAPSAKFQQLLVEGRYLMEERLPDPIHAAMERFSEAIRMEPRNAEAYAGLAECYDMTASGLPAPERRNQAEFLARRALELDPNSSQAHTALAFALYKFDWNWTEAEVQFRRAVELDARNALALHWFGEFLVLRGRPDEGLARLRQAVALEPTSLASRNDLARALYRTRHFEEAIAEARHVMELDPHFNAYATITYAYEAQQAYDQAIAADLQALRVMQPNAPAVDVSRLREVYAEQGWRAYWRARLELAMRQPAGSVSAYTLAEDALRAGQPKSALRYLNESFERHGDAPLLIGCEPLWDALRSNTQFQFLLRRAALG